MSILFVKILLPTKNFFQNAVGEHSICSLNERLLQTIKRENDPTKNNHPFSSGCFELNQTISLPSS